MRGRLPSRQATGLYVHSSPPTGVPVHDSTVRQWLRGGEMSRLKELVLEGEGASLVGEYSPDVTARAFLRALPRVLSRIDEAHRAASEGDVAKTERAIRRERAVRVELSKDQSGLSLLHKAVIFGHKDLQENLLKAYPELVHLTDRERRTALHYAGSSPEPEDTWKRLTDAGSDPAVLDSSGNSPAYYMHHPRRARPPQPRGPQPSRSERGLVVKPANIRIWIHDRDLGRLQRVVWEGYGHKLLTEVSSQPKVKRFLSAVPYILGSIRDVHKAAIDNDVETLQKKAADPVPKDILLSKDINGLNPLHKAAGLGNKEALAEILRRAPEAANSQDSQGRTPLHYAAATRDSGLYEQLVEGGATDHLQDKKGNTPSYYRSKPAELEAGKLLNYVPEAPRTAHIFPPSWDWRLLHPASSGKEEPVEKLTPDSTLESEPISKSEPMEESKPEVSEDEGVGSENAMEDAISPQNSENIDLETEDEPADKLGQTITLSKSDVFGEDSGAMDDAENQLDKYQEEERKEIEQPEEENVEVTSEPKADIEETADEEKEEEPKGAQEISLEQEESETQAAEDNPKEDATPEEDNPKEDATPEEDNPKEDATPEGTAAVEESSTKVEENMKETTVDQADPPKLIRSETIVLPKTNSQENEETTEEETEEPAAPSDDQAGQNQEQNGVVTDGEDSNQEGTEAEETAKQSETIEEEGAQSNSVEAKEEENPQEEVETKPEDKVEDKVQESSTSGKSVKSSSGLSGSSKSSGTASGRQSLKSRVKKAIELGRGQEGKILSEGIVEKDEVQEAKEEIKAKDEEHFPDSLEDIPAKEVDKEEQLLGEENVQEENSSDNSHTSAAEKLKGEGDRSSAERLVASGDMEGMAEMVLAGEGEALLDLKSDNPDVQLFINNVPHYMAKIEKVHKASREGDLRGVQTSLDRRKFAVARDNGTSLKPTPLHVAVLFGRTSVLRYLAGRFPETMHAQDSGGRTPLHYATTLPDNGHFYSLLITLGADKAIPDNDGRTAEFYLRNKGELTREMLLAQYQDRSVPIDMSGLNFNRYSDKGAEILREGYPIFKPEEGQYLASSLGEPLIKGLTEVAQLRPSNPIIHLANFLLAYKKPEEEEIPQKILRSIEGTPAGHDEPTDENMNPEAEEQAGTEEVEDGEEGVEENGEEVQQEGEELMKDEDEEGIESINNEEEERRTPEPATSFKPVNRDEHGQSMLHFAAARSHGRNAMYQLLQELDANPGLRDSLYRTARDIAEQTDINDNVKGIDKFVVSLAAKGEENRLRELLLEGYDHILDAEDGENIIDIAEEREQESIVKLLNGITQFEENREKLHRAIRFGSLAQVQEIFNKSESKHRLAVAKNMQGRCSLHVAVLSQHEATVEHIASKYPDTLHIGDNLMRTPLHYAMALEKVESLSKIMIAAGAERVLKDLKGRQPSYYFMNKMDIQKLQEEEEALRV